MIQGTGSDVGKSILVAGLARAFTNRGLAVQPFKPQNMSNNAAVTSENGEIGRAQWLQALACKTPPSVHMNPVLLKPETDRGAQVILQGQVAGHSSASGYQTRKSTLLPHVMESFDVLRQAADLVVIEGAGSPAEVNLRANDIANMGFALPAKSPVVLVGDIDRGGVIAALVGTHALLSDQERALIKGFIINKFRGDMSLFDDGLSIIEERTGWRGFGIVPYLTCVAELPAEDAVFLERNRSSSAAAIKVAIPMLSRIANFDDVDPLRAHPEICVMFCPPGTRLPDDADLIIVPGTKATIADLRFLKAQGWDRDIRYHLDRRRPVLGLCGGYQMLGRTVSDPQGIEGSPDTEPGLGLLDVETVLHSPKTVRNVTARYTLSGLHVPGYEIHCGQTTGADTGNAFLAIGDKLVSARSSDGLVYGSYVHGLFLDDRFRRTFMHALGLDLISTVDYRQTVEQALDSLADALEEHLDIDAMLRVSA